MKFLLGGVCALLAGSAVAQPVPAPTVTAEKASAADLNRTVCKTAPSTGSRVRPRRTCGTEKEWRRLHEASARAYYEMVNHARGCDPGACSTRP